MTGLDDVIAAETVLSHVDGGAGRLLLRGLPVEQAAASLDFEEMLGVLWQGFHPLAADRPSLRARLGTARVAIHDRLACLLPALSGLSPVEGLRLMLASLPDDEDGSDAIKVAAAIPVFIAAQHRHAQGLAPLVPDAAAGHAADFLRLLTGQDVAPALARALDTYLVTVSDHGLNASTFAARVVASTRAGMISSVVAALCALKGPLHGGAPGPVLDMLDAVGTAANAPEKAALTALRQHRPDRPLETNVEFYTALLLDAVGLDRALFTPVFAMGRVAGWTAHVMEQGATGRLLRPQSRYIGPAAAA